jgi:hypothetical protein
MKLVRGAMLVGMVLLLQACAVGNMQTVAKTPPTIDLSTSESAALAVALGVQDRRPYVLNGDKDPDFVGLQRGGFGNPFDVTTGGDVPLSQDFQTSITAALKAKDVTVTPVQLAPADSEEARLAAFKKSGVDKWLWLLISEWKSDTYTNTALNYDLELSVFDAEGKLLASQKAAGEDDLGGSFMNPPAHAKKAVPEAFQRIVGALFNDPKIKAALD